MQAGESVDGFRSHLRHSAFSKRIELDEPRKAFKIAFSFRKNLVFGPVRSIGSLGEETFIISLRARVYGSMHASHVLASVYGIHLLRG